MKRALFQLHAAVFLAGFTAVLGKLIGLNEGLLVWYRLLITVVTLGIILLVTRQLERLSLKNALQICAVGVIVGLHWITFYGSVKYSNISVALTCFSATGFFTALLEPLIFKTKVQFVEILLGLLALTGIWVIFDFHPQYKTGIIFGIVSAVGSALFPIFNKRFVEKFKPRTVTFYELGGGLIGLTVLVPLYLMKFPAVYYQPTIMDWIWLLVLAWFCTVLAFDLQLRALKKISAFTANLTYNLEPVYGIILAFIFFKENENLNPQFYIGLMLIMSAVVIQMIRVKKKMTADS